MSGPTEYLIIQLSSTSRETRFLFFFFFLFFVKLLLVYWFSIAVITNATNIASGNNINLLSDSFCRSEVQVNSAIFCLGSYRAEIKMLAGVHFLLETLEHNCFQAHSNCWLNSVYAVVRLRCLHSLTGCFVSQGSVFVPRGGPHSFAYFLCSPLQQGRVGFCRISLISARENSLLKQKILRLGPP